MGRLLGCLGECCAAARNAPDAAKIAGAVLELSLNPAVFAHTQPHVRRAALFACVGAVTSVPPAAAWHALSGGVGGVAAGSPLAGLLAALEDGAGWARGRDPDGDVRALALRAQLSAADLRQRAVAVGTAGGVDPNRADPMYLLKNVSSLMIGDM
jgi:telomere length regulation protein